jgi:hypothetical protein
MEKTELMKRFENETQMDSLYVPDDGHDAYTYWYVEWLEAKAEVYDRLMGGGKKTPKEAANFFGHPIAMDAYTSSDDNPRGDWCCFKHVPVIDRAEEIWSNNRKGWFARLPYGLIEYTGDWEKSLTLPDGWEDK